MFNKFVENDDDLMMMMLVYIIIYKCMCLYARQKLSKGSGINDRKFNTKLNNINYNPSQCCDKLQFINLINLQC